MQQPIVINLPHKLGRAEAKQRIANGVGRVTDYIPGGGEAASRWEGDRLILDIKAMGQAVTGHIDVEEQMVRLEVMLPPILAMFASRIGGFLANKGTELLEDKSKT